MDPLIVVFGFGVGILVGPAALAVLVWGIHMLRSRGPRSPRRAPVPSEASS